MKLGVIAAAVLGFSATSALAQQPPASAAAPSAAALKSEDDKTAYALGLSIGRSIKLFELSPAELELVKKGITDSANNVKPAVDLDQYGPKFQAFAASRQEKTGQRFLEEAAKEKGAQKLPSGVILKELKAGTGPSPKPTDTVKVNYRGTLTSGMEFDSSYKHGQPAEFPLNGVIPCWTEGVQKMKVGGKVQLVCPAKSAYGEQGQPPTIPPNSTLVFDVELLSIGGQGADVPRAEPKK